MKYILASLLIGMSKNQVRCHSTPSAIVPCQARALDIAFISTSFKDQLFTGTTLYYASFRVITKDPCSRTWKYRHLHRPWSVRNPQQALRHSPSPSRIATRRISGERKPNPTYNTRRIPNRAQRLRPGGIPGKGMVSCAFITILRSPNQQHLPPHHQRQSNTNRCSTTTPQAPSRRQIHHLIPPKRQRHDRRSQRNIIPQPPDTTQLHNRSHLARRNAQSTTQRHAHWLRRNVLRTSSPLTRSTSFPGIFMFIPTRSSPPVAPAKRNILPLHGSPADSA